MCSSVSACCSYAIAHNCHAVLRYSVNICLRCVFYCISAISRPQPVIQFNICRSVHHQYIRRVQPTRCNVSRFIYFCISLHVRRFFRPSSGAQNCIYSVRYLSDCNDVVKNKLLATVYMLQWKVNRAAVKFMLTKWLKLIC